MIIGEEPQLVNEVISQSHLNECGTLADLTPSHVQAQYKLKTDELGTWTEQQKMENHNRIR